MIDRIIQNKGANPYIKFSKQGSFFSSKNNSFIHYDSSYELQAYQILEQLSEVKTYSRCKFSIDYTFKDSVHKYIPDILATYQSDKQEVIEVKPEGRLQEERNQIKFEAAKDYCKQNNLVWSIWTEKELFTKETS